MLLSPCCAFDATFAVTILCNAYGLQHFQVIQMCTGASVRQLDACEARLGIQLPWQVRL